jgi:predicted nucleic acid-binding protein
VSFVLDSSMTLAWYFEDERTEERTAVLQRVAAEGAIVPAHWRLEVLNGFQAALRRQRIDRAYRDASLVDLESLLITIDSETNLSAWAATLQLSDRLGLTAYDAAYLELALRRRLPLATLDGDLIRAARSENVPLVGVT